MRFHVRYVLASLAIVFAARQAAAAEQTSLCEAALRAAGIESTSEIERHLSRLDDLCETLRSRIPPNAPCRERAAVLLDALHKDLLRGPYNPHLWNIAETLESGAYNCLTATILYLDLCERFEISASAVFQPGHLLCRVEDDPPFHVETTCARWFDLESPATPSLASRVLNRAEILAKVHYNRAAALLAEDRFEAALACLRTSRRLDPLDNAARKNEAAALYNRGLQVVEMRAKKRPRDGARNLTRPEF
jgi:hypothetical protein